MKTWMKTALVTSLVAATALGGTAVMARGGDCDSHGMRDGGGWGQMEPEAREARMAEHFETRVGRLELGLALTPEQKPAWTRLKEALADSRTDSISEHSPSDSHRWTWSSSILLGKKSIIQQRVLKTSTVNS